jgi:hypothetical protein
MKIEQLDMAGKRPMPADRRDRDNLVSVVEILDNSRSGPIHPTGHAASCWPAPLGRT